MHYHELDKARRLLGLGPRATLAEIKNCYRQLAKKHHPDRLPATEENQEQTAEAGQPEIRQINAAYRLLLAYTADYAFSFSEEEFYRQNPEENLHRQFGNDPLWGNGWSSR